METARAHTHTHKHTALLVATTSVQKDVRFIGLLDIVTFSGDDSIRYECRGHVPPLLQMAGHGAL